MSPELPSVVPNLTVLLIVAAGFALMLGAGSVFKRLLLLGGAGVVAILLVPALLGHAGTELGQLPTWLLVLVGGLSTLGLLGAFASLFIGRGAADSMVGELAAQLVRLTGGIFIFPVRLVQRFFRGFGDY